MSTPQAASPRLGGVSVATAVDGAPGLTSVPFGSNSVQHGTAVFEGIRSHAGPRGPLLFRLDDHIDRLLGSAAALGIEHPYGQEELRRLIVEAMAASGLADAYVRPVLYTPEPRLGVDLARFAFRLGVETWAAPGAEAPAGPGIRLTVSPWTRPSPRTFPTGAKATGNYAVSALAKTHAVRAGYDDAVQLDPHTGRVAEATIANIFAVRSGRLVTPWTQESLLPGITRDTVLRLAEDLGIDTSEEPLTVDDLAGADELFLTGTASGLVSVASFGKCELPPERAVFEGLNRAYRDCVRGRGTARSGWLAPVVL
ncbi:aminotransferase class IV [Streptomyces anulatus]|uniref:aminotransferase class IV n=1 Tax=Streptomyces anulatus TaxID=1892 RepID=UPI00224F027B|nr:aminotransferase class IV [Streptomyces anulatus]MCX4521949.1 aminotransferase class IV [Streptomyces anulatus]MCX4604825.1 aminotransferase class IV [Streptomyces anulatus]WTE29648.1 aminotransferase class IV [Streptomyces anulatus]